MKRLAGGIAVVCGMAFAGNAAAVTLIDDFSGAVQQTSDAVAEGTPTASSSGVVNPSGSPFTTREITTSKTGGATNASVTAGVNSFDLEFFTISSLPTVSSITSLLYTGSGVDLSGGGLNDVFIVNVFDSDVAFDIDVTFTDGVNTDTETISVTGPLSNDTITFSFADFGGVDFSSIAGLSLVIASASALDAQFTLLTTIDSTPPSAVPLPATALLLMAGLGGLAMARRRV
ncbi:MAG: VPLPA-CTERM sorting domain-containing protein [Pseudomonadota bacterium]